MLLALHGTRFRLLRGGWLSDWKHSSHEMKHAIRIALGIAAILLPDLGVAAAEITLKEFKVTFADPWKLLDTAQKEATGLEAVWVNPESKRPNAAVLAKALAKPVATEADELIASLAEQPDVVKLLEDRKVPLKGGGEARVVSLELRVANAGLGIEAPMIFHSLYLPTKDGKSVTFKLQCSKGKLETLKPTFESAVLAGLVGPPANGQGTGVQTAPSPEPSL